MSNDNFQLYASYYNLLYRDKDYKSEVEYVESLFRKFASRKISHILNLGCGTGNHDFLFAEKGYMVHGVDLSESMVEDAKKRANDSGSGENVLFSQGDIRTIQFGKKFDAVISLFHVMSYQTENSDIESVFQTAHEHLEKGGLFVFDCWHGPAVLADPPVVKVKEVENELISVHRMAKPIIHLNENIVDVNFEIQVTRKKDKSLEKFDELHRMRYLFEPELNLIAHHSGFSDLASYKWLTLEKSSELSWNVVYVFKKDN